MKITRALVLPCLVACAAGVLSCSSQSDNPSNTGLDASGAAKEVGGDAATSGGSDAGPPTPDAQAPDAQRSDAQPLDAPGPDVQTLDAQGPEATLPVDVGADRVPVGPQSDVGASDAGLAPDSATMDSAAPQTAPDGDADLLDDAGPDAGARDANATEARAPDATPLDTSTPDAKVDGPAADAKVMDATADSLTPSLDVGPATCGRIKCDCTFKGVKLWGNVQYVTMFPDFKVKVSAFPDLNVNETYFASQCGQWHIVTAFPDFTVQIVDMFEDFDIAYSSFPGIP